MTYVKHGFLAAAAAFVPAGALAADLPSTKSAPVQYVRVCDVYGSGFFYIPGTQTCLKVGGRVRMQMNYVPARSALLPTAAAVSAAGVTTPSAGTFVNANGIDALGWYARGHIRMDARTQSAWGTVQTVLDLRLESRSGQQAHSATTFIAGESVSPTLISAYIRFAGFTFGRASDVFSFMPSNMYGSYFWSDFTNNVKQLAYTATFGGGFSATLALEDTLDYDNRSVGVLGGITGGPLQRGGVTGRVGSARLPALVGNIRIEQGWGQFQIMGEVEQITANVVNPTALGVINANGPLIKKIGFAVGSGLKINLPMLAKGDAFWLTGAYAKGSLAFISQNYASAPGSKRSVGGLIRNDNPITLFGVGGTAAATAAGVGAELTQAWSVGGLFLHYWTPQVRQNFAASYASFTPGSQTRNTDWTKGGQSRATAWQVSTNVIWTPVSGLDIGAEVGYVRVNQRLTGDPGLAPTALPAVAAAIKVKPNNWETRLRVQRDF